MSNGNKLRGSPINTMTCFSVGWMLFYCIWRWHDIKTTLDRRFVFAGITTAILIVKCRIWKITNAHSSHPMLVQCCVTVFHTGPELKHHWIKLFPLWNVETKGWSGSSHRGALFTLPFPFKQWMENHPTCTSENPKQIRKNNWESFKKSHTNEPQYLGIIRFEVDWIISHYKPRHVHPWHWNID